MDAKPSGGGGRGRGRGKVKSSESEPLRQLTFEKKENDRGDTFQSIDVADDMSGSESRPGSPRGRGIGRGRSETREPPKALLKEDDETKALPSSDYSFGDKEEVSQPKKTEEISGEISAVFELKKAIANENLQEGEGWQLSELRETVSREAHLEGAKGSPLGKETVTSKKLQGDAKVSSPLFKVKEAVARENLKEDSKVSLPLSKVKEAVARENLQEGAEAYPLPEVREAVVWGSLIEGGEVLPPLPKVKKAIARENLQEGARYPLSEVTETVALESLPKGVQAYLMSEIQETESQKTHQEDGHENKFASNLSSETTSGKKTITQAEDKTEGLMGIIEMKTNHFYVMLKPGHPGVAEYHISTEPVVEHLDIIRSLFKTEQAYDVLGRMQVVDGRNLYVFKILPGDVVVSFNTNFEETNYRVNLELMDIKPINHSMAIINNLLAKLMGHLGYKKTVEHFYDPTMEKVLSNHRVCLWPGIDLTAEFKRESFKVSVELTRLIHQQDNVLIQLEKLRGDPQMRSKFEKLIIGKIVITKYNLKHYNILNVAWDLRPDTKFLRKGKEISFKDSVKSCEDISIMDNDQPILITKLKCCGNDACKQCGRKNIIGLIPELCYIVGLTKEQDSKLKVMTELMEATNELFEKDETSPATFVNRVLGDNVARGFFRACGLYLVSSEEASVEEADKDL